ncbi:uncharacterized protein BYT42DRAFT_392626 [Radiomyces spectabilis]|uniref:uncharacterized protein n=1 Tax=Radiomyces spectabilis TaxID=64574 RepID=UPI00221F967E|nr:uncharacterized protein BYT42DRAFT_392626 [Radiomyces spectabilis]KAI8374139.1 hypothetical protein BYT42DRAFT_392626 [Radiomyces spectabilis]
MIEKSDTNHVEKYDAIRDNLLEMNLGFIRLQNQLSNDSAKVMTQLGNFVNALAKVTSKLEEVKNEISEVRKQNAELHDKVQHMETELRVLRGTTMVGTGSASSPLTAPPVHSSIACTIPPMERTVQHPIVMVKKIVSDGSEQTVAIKAQFSWKLYEDLLKQALGSAYKREHFLMAKSNIKPVALRACLRLRNDYEARTGESTVHWKDIENDLQVNAFFEFEEAARHLFPLCMCVGNWGARLLLRKYWSITYNSRRNRTAVPSKALEESDTSSDSENE